MSEDFSESESDFLLSDHSKEVKLGWKQSFKIKRG